MGNGEGTPLLSGERHKMSRISVPGVGSIPFTEEGILSAFSTQRDLVLRLRADLEGTNNELLRIR